MISRKDDGVNIVCAPTGIIPVKRPGRGIAYLSDAGFENMLLDFSLCCPPEELVKVGKENFQYSERIKEGMLLLAEQCKKSGMQMKIAHAPYLPRNYKDSNLNDLLHSAGQRKYPGMRTGGLPMHSDKAFVCGHSG